jgi:hypothetical protein
VLPGWNKVSHDGQKLFTGRRAWRHLRQIKTLQMSQHFRGSRSEPIDPKFSKQTEHCPLGTLAGGKSVR